MSRSDTWMPLYIGDYLRDTGHLTVGEHGAYLLLLMQAWTSGGALPADASRLRTIAKMGTKQWGEASKVVMQFFYREGEVFRHKRLDKELSNARSNTEQRKTAGKASADARKAQRKVNETVNGNPTDVAPAVAIPLEQNGRPSPSPSPKDSASLRSADADASEPDIKTLLWREGVAILRRLTKRPDGPVRKLLGNMVDYAQADHVMLLDVLRQAETHQPDQPAAWIKAAVQSRLTPSLLPDGPPDPYGIRAWIARQPGVTMEKFQGVEVACIGDFPAEACMLDMAMAAELDETWRGNWDAMGAWMREGIMVSDPALLREIKRFARSISGSIGSIKIFDPIIRGAERAA